MKTNKKDKEKEAKEIELDESLQEKYEDKEIVEAICRYIG